jgi:cell filamentation protein
MTATGIGSDSATASCLNYAGCLDREEIHRREDEGVARAMELVAGYLDRPEPVALSASLVQQVHTELMGAIYPFAGAWRTVSTCTKGMVRRSGHFLQVGSARRWTFSNATSSRAHPLSPPRMRRSTASSARCMGELIAIHPFREGNGRTAFIVGNLVLMQNDLLPLDVYDRRSRPGRATSRPATMSAFIRTTRRWRRSSPSGSRPHRRGGRLRMAEVGA